MNALVRAARAAERLLACADLNRLSRRLCAELRRLVPADEVLFDISPLEMNRPALARRDVDPDWAERYNREFFALNPALPEMRRRLGKDGWLAERFERLCSQPLRTTDFYRRYMEPQRHRTSFVLAVSLSQAEEAPAAIVLLIRHRGRPPFSAGESATLRLLAPAIALAVRRVALSKEVWLAFVAQRTLGLPRRQAHVAALVATGSANKQIAARLGLTLGTTKHYIHQVLERTGCGSRSELCRKLLG